MQANSGEVRHESHGIELAALWSAPQLIELLMLAGWYRAISYICNATRVPLEAWAARWQR